MVLLTHPMVLTGNDRPRCIPRALLRSRDALHSVGVPIRCCTFPTLLLQLDSAGVHLLSLNTRYGLLPSLNFAIGNL